MVAPVNANAVIEKRHREEDLLCGICKGIVVEAMQTNCGHLFCSKCLHQVTDHKCPVCRNQPYNAREDRNAERRAKDLVRACINEDQGCTFAGDRHATVLHEARCGFVPRAVLRIHISMIENELTATKLLLQAAECSEGVELRPSPASGRCFREIVSRKVFFCSTFHGSFYFGVF